MRLACTYCPPWRMEPDMSMITAVAHLGCWRVRCTTMSSPRMRTGAPGARGPAADSRSIAFTMLCGMSIAAGLSPNSYGRVDGSSTAPSALATPSCRPLRAACRSPKIVESSPRW